jgi:hypothetical protein
MSLVNERNRIRNIIEGDRLTGAELFIQICETDITNLLKDYFDIDSKVNLAIIKKENMYEIKISTLAKKLKSFNSLAR